MLDRDVGKFDTFTSNYGMELYPERSLGEER